MKLEWWHRAILRRPEDEAYWTARDIGADIWMTMTRSQASACAANHLRAMQAAGLVERADDGKNPLIWRRTPAGRAALGGQDGE